MCGINGTFNLPPDAILRMNGALAHRGPDFAGTFTDGAFSFGHRLLSIRDAAAVSRQPVLRDGSPWVLIFNGQLYNVRAMKAELGVEYAKVDLDTTLLYALIEKYGWNFISHIEGMYAIGLYNKHEKQLRLYRDPAGQKPVYTARLENGFAFSSEIRGLTAAGVETREVDEVARACALSIGFVPGRRTLFKNISKLAPGEILTIDLTSGMWAYGSIPAARTRVFTGEPAEVMQELIAEHLASKQPVALNLSGGLDSSLILHESVKAGHPVHTYSTRFENADEKSNDDAECAKRLAKDYGATHTELTITRDAYLDALEDAYTLVEEPNYNISLPVYLLTARAEGVHGDGNRVVLSGDGGDELFGGYPHYALSTKYAALLSRYPHWFVRLYKGLREGMSWNWNDPVSLWLHNRFFAYDTHSEQKKLRDETLEYLHQSVDPTFTTRAADPIRDSMLLDRTFWLAGENFIRSDKLFMSESLEMRAPLAYEPLRKYFDARLSERDYRTGATNKRFLRELYTGKLPDYITQRTMKTGWRAPISAWWDASVAARFADILAATPPGGRIDWKGMSEKVRTSEHWPGKRMHLYLSLALLSRSFTIVL